MSGQRLAGWLRTFCVLVLLSSGIGSGVAQTFTNASELVTLAGTQPVLGSPIYTNGQVRFNVTGGVFNGFCSLQTSTDLVSWTTIATNVNPTRTITNTPDPGAPCFYRLSRSPIPLCQFGLAAVGSLGLNGNAVIVDSFDSSDTNQSVNGLYDGYVGTNGSLASYGGVINLGNDVVDGNVYLGPIGTFSSSPSQVTGQIYFDANFALPDVVLPSASWYPAPVFTLGGLHHDFTVNGFFTVGDADNIVVEPGVTVSIHVTITNFDPPNITIAGGTTNSGTLIVYQDAGSAFFSGNSYGGPIGNRAQNFVYLGMPGVTNVTWSSAGSAFTGAIYAPEARFTSVGPSFYYIGSCVITRMLTNGHYTFHYDQSLLTSGPYY